MEVKNEITSPTRGDSQTGVSTPETGKYKVPSTDTYQEPLALSSWFLNEAFFENVSDHLHQPVEVNRLLNDCIHPALGDLASVELVTPPCQENEWRCPTTCFLRNMSDSPPHLPST